MSTKSGILELIAGAAEVTVGALIAVGTIGIGAPLAAPLISMGAGLMMAGIGSIIAGDTPAKGIATTSKNSINPWEVIYGRQRVGGTLVYDQTWGANNAMRDLVIVLGACKFESIDRMLFDQQFVQMNTTPGYAFPPTPLTPGYSTGPSNDGPTSGGYLIATIARSNDVVTVTLTNTIPFLESGDQVIIQDNNGGTELSAHGLIGKVQVSEIITESGGYVSAFTYLSGGVACSISGNGQAKTAWPNYGNNIYVEWTNGGGVPGQAGGTFSGMLNGTPYLGTGELITPENPGPVGYGQGYSSSNKPTNPWTAFCSLQGKTAVFIRITGNTSLFPAGLPLISFLVHGKSDIYDPRLGPATGIAAGGFTNNGSGYAAGDVLSIGSGGAEVTVISVTNGAIYFKITTPGTGYSLGAQTVTGGSGSGAAFTVTKLGGSTGTLAYTENAALCIADYVSNPDWGYNMAYGASGVGIPLAPLIAAANTCDTTIATVVGGSEPLFACNGKFNLSQSRGEVLQDMMTSCAGRYTTIGGQFVIWPGIWYGGSPTAVDLMAISAGPVKWKPTVTIRDFYNACKGTYVSPQNKWQSTDFPYYAQDAMHGYSGPPQYGGDINLAADGGQRRYLEIHLKFTISSRQAQQTAKIELLRRRHAGTGTFALNMAGYSITAMDVLSATHAFLGWSGKLLEVSADRLKLNRSGSGDKEVMCLSTEIEVQETDSSIYVWSEEEELTPQGYVQVDWPTAAAAENPYTPWPLSPGFVAPLAGDAVYPEGATGPGTFGITPVLGADAQGNATANVQIAAYAPINNLDLTIALPQISAVGSATGGSLPDGTYAVVMAARDSGSTPYKDTQFLQPVLVVVSGGGGHGSIVVTIENGAGDDGGDLFIAALGSLQPQPSGQTMYAWHWNQSVGAGGTSATITVFDQSQQGVPDAYFDHMAVAWMEVIHSGNWADTIVSVTATTVTIGAPAGITANQFAGYPLALLAKFQQGIPIPVLNLAIASHTATTGGVVVYTIGPNANGVQIADLTTLLAPGDLMVCRYKATFTPNSFTDPNIVNAYYPSGADDVESGYVAVVLTGADAGDVQTIASVGAGHDEFILTGQWAITPAAGDIVIVCAPGLSPEVPSPGLWASQLGQVATLSFPLANLAEQTWLFLLRAEAANGGHCPDSFAPMRDAYFFGYGGTLLVSASGSQT